MLGENPYDPEEIDLRLQITTPGSRSLSIPAFYYQAFERERKTLGRRPSEWLYPVGKAQWRARFAPTEPGEYRCVATLRDRAGEAKSPGRGEVAARHVHLPRSQGQGLRARVTERPTRPRVRRRHALLPRRPERGLHSRHLSDGRDVRPPGPQRRQLRQGVGLLRGLGDGHRGPPQRVGALVGLAPAKR